MKLFCPFVFLVLLSATAFAFSNLNKTPKTVHWEDACDECQLIIKRVVNVATDPEKVAELKILLSALCQETSYVEECRLFVSKLDLFLGRLLPFLRDAHHVCKELRICNNGRLQQFHVLGLHFARVNASFQRKDLICEECQLAARELAREVSEPKFQQYVEEWLQGNVCVHLGTLKSSCEQMLDEFLPEMWRELEDILSDQKKFCQDLELCPAGISSPSSARRPTAQSKARKKTVHVLSTRRCIICRAVTKLLEMELEKAKVQKALIAKLEKLLCDRIPPEDEAICKSVVKSYIPLALTQIIRQLQRDELCYVTHSCQKPQLRMVK
ncbi:hypothetical protein niasHS_002504 [Heterodera schachtii]|uniref:Saposin B-type domain-containing protein n=1 Tax=Heterodera schachtii TaxID=97005 RepID=A0ABD2KKF2_HETSC